MLPHAKYIVSNNYTEILHKNPSFKGGGNFLGEYVSIAMDRLRQSVGLMVKHLAVQIAQLVTPEFSNELPPCLIGNQAGHVNLGLKSLQLC